MLNILKLFTIIILFKQHKYCKKYSNSWTVKIKGSNHNEVFSQIKNNGFNIIHKVYRIKILKKNIVRFIK